MAKDKISLIREFCMYSHILPAWQFQDHISSCISVCTVTASRISEPERSLYTLKLHLPLENMQKNQLSTWFYLQKYALNVSCNVAQQALEYFQLKPNIILSEHQ